MGIILSEHVKDMLKERNIPEQWLWNTINKSDFQEIGIDNNLHFFKNIEEFGKRVLHVIVNSQVTPNKVVTAFFDRRKGALK